MKRYNGLHDKLCTIENIEVADDNARKNKNKKYGINKHDKNRQYENEDLVDKLFNLKYKTSKYSLYKIYEPKERIIYRLSYYPDRIAHHAIMNVVKDIWTKSFIHNIYSCIDRLNHFPINFKITKYDWRIYAKNRKEKVKPQT
jgi:hypothetical protein